jgi:acyl-CoA synthetase (AMP-forming)/AMP-acid ligase II
LGFLRDGELFITSRLKDLIVIDGRNHCPHDIEWTVENSHRCVRPASSAALSIAVDGPEQLVILAEVDPYDRREQKNPDPGSDTASDDAIVRAIRRAVAECHDVQAHAVLLLRPGSIPKTSSGKIQRHVCRSAFAAGDLGGLEK